MAKSILDDHNIFCSLADENANLYGGAPFAMPVRLLVSEEQADEARRILETRAQEFKDLASTGERQEENSTNNNMSEILDELKQLRSKIENHTAIFLILAIFLACSSVYRTYFQSTPSRARQGQTETWNSARTAMDNFEYDKAAEIAQRLVEKNPKYYYGYAFLGQIALVRNQLKEAERCFAHAYELFPTDDNQQKLEATRKRLAAENPR